METLRAVRSLVWSCRWFAGVAVLAFALGWAVCHRTAGAKRADAGDGSPTPAADPRWPLGARVQVGYTDPERDQHARGLVEVVRIVEADGSVSMTPEGKHDAPRVEWKWHFDSGRSYFAIPRER